MENRKSHLELAVPGALLGAMLSCTVFGDNLTRDNASRENGSPETMCDPQGFAAKVCTSEGNPDRVGNNLPLFFSRDASKVSDIVHGFNASQTDNLPSSERFFDFFSHVPKATNKLTHLQTGFGIPASYQLTDGNSVNALKDVYTSDEITQFKFPLKSHTWSQVAQCEWHSSDSSKTLVAFQFSVRVPTFLSATPSQASVASSGSNVKDFGCSG